MEAIRTDAGLLWSGHVSPALCLDLDGTIRRSKSGKPFIEGPEDIELFPDVEAKIMAYRDDGWMIFGVSNQGGVAHGFKTSEQVMAELDATIALFKENPFHIVKLCYHDAAGSVFPYNKRSLLRKPSYGMLALMEAEAFDYGYLIDWDNSLFIGDRVEDAECAVSAGIPFKTADDFFERSVAG